MLYPLLSDNRDNDLKNLRLTFTPAKNLSCLFNEFNNFSSDINNTP